MSAASRCFSRTWSVLKAVGHNFVSDNGFLLSSALAFNLLLYFIPLALSMVSLLGYTAPSYGCFRFT